LHFPSPRGARVLPGTLPSGVRTFLTVCSCDSSALLLGPLRCYSIPGAVFWQENIFFGLMAAKLKFKDSILKNN